MPKKHDTFPKFGPLSETFNQVGKGVWHHVSDTLSRLRYRMSCMSFAACLFVPIAWVGLSVHPAMACAFDLIKPEHTVIDWIVEADTLVLARPSATNPFAFDVINVLAGSEVADPIPQLVDSSARRRLVAHPGDAVLFARTTSGKWRRVAYVDGAFRGILDTALSNRATWAKDMPQSRIDFIDLLQDAPDPRHRAIAIGELDKVPYAQLQTFDLRIPAQDLIANLWTVEAYPYQAIHALLIGLSGSEDARTLVSEFIHNAKGRAQPANLGAFAAAYIELEGAGGISVLADEFLHDPSQSLDTLEQIVMAMSVHHALADTLQKDSINAALAKLVQDRPAAGVLVARQFLLRANWSQSAALEGLVRDRRLKTTDQLLAVTVYLAKAHSRNESRAATQKGG